MAAPAGDVMELISSDLSVDKTYKLLTGVVVPRPIAWITTLSPGGKVNAAPFSAFVIVSTDPAMVGISVSRRAGEIKDTERNIRGRREFVVNIADFSQLQALHDTSEVYPPEVSEAELLGLETAASRLLSVPRLAAAPGALECRLHSILPFGRQHHFVVGEVVAYHLRDGLLVDGKVATQALGPIARVGGPNYAELGVITPQASQRAPRNTPCFTTEGATNVKENVKENR